MASRDYDTLKTNTGLSMTLIKEFKYKKDRLVLASFNP